MLLAMLNSAAVPLQQIAVLHHLKCVLA